jgi:hypothetical protein
MRFEESVCTGQYNLSRAQVIYYTSLFIVTGLSIHYRQLGSASLYLLLILFIDHHDGSKIVAAEQAS